MRSLGVAVHDVALTDKKLRAVSFAGDGLAPTTLVNGDSHAFAAERRRRFTLAHELCHLLFDRDRGARLAIASGPWAAADVERRANAFAASILMPEAAVARAVDEVSAPLDSVDGVRSVADALGASVSATIARLHILGHIDDETEDALKEEWMGPG
jgi:Zn-dependent peptidase ImmA (M78 family)